MQTQKPKKHFSENFENSLSSILAPTVGRIWDIYALALINPLIREFIPWTGVAIRPYTALNIINDILINDRELIVEMGAGVSTVLVAQALKGRGKGLLISFEDDKEWARFLSNDLKSRNLEEFCKVVHAPLERCKSSISEEGLWYKEAVVHEHVFAKKIDLLLVDGPKASGDRNQLARFPAVPVLKEYFSDSYAVYLDDIRRKGEKEILAAWSQQLSCKAVKSPVKGNFASIKHGHSYYSRP